MLEKHQYCAEFMDKTKLYLLSKGIFRTSFLILNHVYYSSYVVWILVFFPLKMCGFQDFFYTIEGKIQLALIKMLSMWSQGGGYEVLETGDDITECLDERTLVLINHQTTGDVPMILNAFISRDQILPNVMWIMDHYFRYSHFGLICTVHKDFFIVQKQKTSLAQLEKHIKEFYIPLKRKWLVLFPEGGFLYKRKQRSQNYGKIHNLPHLEHVTIPRTGALEVIMDNLTTVDDKKSEQGISTNHLKYVLDVTIGYAKGEPIDIFALITGHKAPSTTTIHYRLYRISEVPKDKEGLRKWLLERWVEKEKLLENFYRSGEFPNIGRPKVVRQSLKGYILLHFAFLASTYLQYRIFMNTYNYFHK